jgi:hypothetical protein
LTITGPLYNKVFIQRVAVQYFLKSARRCPRARGQLCPLRPPQRAPRCRFAHCVKEAGSGRACPATRIEGTQTRCAAIRTPWNGRRLGWRIKTPRRTRSGSCICFRRRRGEQHGPVFNEGRARQQLDQDGLARHDRWIWRQDVGWLSARPKGRSYEAIRYVARNGIRTLDATGPLTVV